jgi:hypothetical protein
VLRSAGGDLQEGSPGFRGCTTSCGESTTFFDGRSGRRPRAGADARPALEAGATGRSPGATGVITQ